MNYNHIDDCWNAIRDAKSIDEVKKLFDEFPRWSGDWDITTETIDKVNKVYVVHNTYEDRTCGWQTDSEILDLEVEEN